MAVNYTTAPYVLEPMYSGMGPTREFYRLFSANQDIRWWENIRAQRIPSGMAQAQRILVVGCGFGFFIEKLRAAGFTNTWGIDLSPYYFEEPRATENFDATVRSRVRQMSVVGMTQAMRRTLTGANTLFDFVITESVMEGYAPGAEQDAILAACEQQRSSTTRPVIHLVFDGVDLSPLGGCPSRTLAEWQASVPANRTNHQFVSLMGVGGS